MKTARGYIGLCYLCFFFGGAGILMAGAPGIIAAYHLRYEIAGAILCHLAWSLRAFSAGFRLIIPAEKSPWRRDCVSPDWNFVRLCLLLMCSSSLSSAQPPASSIIWAMPSIYPVETTSQLISCMRVILLDVFWSLCLSGLGGTMVTFLCGAAAGRYGESDRGDDRHGRDTADCGACVRLWDESREKRNHEETIDFAL